MRGVIATILSVCFILSGCGAGKSPKRLQTPLASTAFAELTAGGDRYEKGCYRSALEYFCRAHEMFSAMDDPRGVAMSLNNIGNVYRHVGKHAEAVQVFDEALDIYRSRAGAEWVVQVLTNKAAALIARRQMKSAWSTLEEAEAIRTKNGFTHLPLLTTRAVLLIEKAAYGEAESLLTGALQKNGPFDLSESANARFVLGVLMLKTGRLDEAASYLLDALEADKEAGLYRATADDLYTLGKLYDQSGDPVRAVDFFRRSAKIHALLGNAEQAGRHLEKMRKAAVAAGVDVSVATGFIENWIEGKRLSDPCR